LTWLFLVYRSFVFLLSSVECGSHRSSHITFGASFPPAFKDEPQFSVQSNEIFLTWPKILLLFFQKC